MYQIDHGFVQLATMAMAAMVAMAEEIVVADMVVEAVISAAITPAIHSQAEEVYLLPASAAETLMLPSAAAIDQSLHSSLAVLSLLVISSSQVMKQQ